MSIKPLNYASKFHPLNLPLLYPIFFQKSSPDLINFTNHIIIAMSTFFRPVNNVFSYSLIFLNPFSLSKFSLFITLYVSFSKNSFFLIRWVKSDWWGSVSYPMAKNKPPTHFRFRQSITLTPSRFLSRLIRTPDSPLIHTCFYTCTRTCIFTPFSTPAIFWSFMTCHFYHSNAKLVHPFSLKTTISLVFFSFIFAFSYSPNTCDFCSLMTCLFLI